MNRQDPKLPKELDQPSTSVSIGVHPWLNLFGALELRVQEYRVYYDVAEEPEPVVTILAVGVKSGSRVLIGGEELELMKVVEK